MTVSVPRNSGWYDANFQPYEISDHADEIAELQLSGTNGLKKFLRSEIQSRAPEETFINLGNRKYLSQTPNGWLLQLVDWGEVHEGTKEEMLKLAEKY